MSYCRFCGKELVNGQCDCAGFQASIHPEYQGAYQSACEEAYQGSQRKDPFLIPSFQPDLSSISAFISSLRDCTGMSEPNSSIGDPYEHDVPIVPDCIEQEENEIVVKQYNVAILRTRLKFMKAEGRLMITNRRVLFRAAGTSLTGNILQEHQFDLDEIGGIEMHKDYKFSILSFLGCLLLSGLAVSLPALFLDGSNGVVQLLFGILLGLVFMAPTFIVYKRFWLKLFCAIIGCGFLSVAYAVSDENGFLRFLQILGIILVLADLIIVCFVPNLVIRIKTKSAGGAVIIGSQKAMFRRETGDDYSGFAEVMPWEDTLMAMNEVGTMIDDLKKQGDYAIDKWSQ